MTDTYDEFSSIEAKGDAGRGRVNPPMVGQQPAQVYTPPTKPTTTGYENLHPQDRAAMAALEGTARGITAGTFDYVPAGLAYLVDRFRNMGKDTKPMSYEELLAATRARTAQVKEENPIAYGTGDVAGSVGLGIATGGTSIPTAMAAQGVQGAVRTYSESPETTLTDAATSAGIQSVLTGGVGLTAKAGGKAIDALEKNYTKGFHDLVKSTEEKLKRAITPAERGYLEQQFVRGTTLPETIKGLVKGSVKEIVSGILPATIGAGLGAGGAAVLGHDPIAGAGLGASGAILATKGKILTDLSDKALQSGGRMSLKHPSFGNLFERTGPATMAKTIGSAVVPLTSKASPKAAPDYSSFSEKDE